MRTLLATLVAVAAVLCMAAPARAEGVDARAQLVAWARGDAGCFTLAITHDPVRFSERSAKTAAKEPEVPASRMVVAQRAEGQQRVWCPCGVMARCRVRPRCAPTTAIRVASVSNPTRRPRTATCTRWPTALRCSMASRSWVRPTGLMW
jgi:hypothetical protein